MFNANDLALIQELTDAIKFFSSKGWTPATSTNYSVRSKNSQEYIITRSGIDKSRIVPEDLILINSRGEVLDRPHLKSSAETGIHTVLYDLFPEVNCVLHTHSLLGTMLSHLYLKEGMLRFADLEIIKGLEGNPTHQMEEFLPIVPNSQDIPEIMSQMEKHFKSGKRLHGFLIAGHGLYSWGKDIASAKRHIETFEFLFECYDMLRRK